MGIPQAETTHFHICKSESVFQSLTHPVSSWCLASTFSSCSTFRHLSLSNCTASHLHVPSSISPSQNILPTSRPLFIALSGMASVHSGKKNNSPPGSPISLSASPSLTCLSVQAPKHVFHLSPMCLHFQLQIFL